MASLSFKDAWRGRMICFTARKNIRGKILEFEVKVSEKGFENNKLKLLQNGFSLLNIKKI
jgi:hypothetical protein